MVSPCAQERETGEEAIAILRDLEYALMAARPLFHTECGHAKANRTNAATPESRPELCPQLAQVSVPDLNFSIADVFNFMVRKPAEDASKIQMRGEPDGFGEAKPRSEAQ